MPTSPKRRRRNPEKDRFRAARRQKERNDRKLRGPQLVFSWFLEGPETGRAAT
jgi:hypothetical protein